MKAIKHYVEHIEDEIEGAECYAEKYIACFNSSFAISL